MGKVFPSGERCKWSARRKTPGQFMALLAAVSLLMAITGSPTDASWQVRHWPLAGEFAADDIHAITQTADGYLWLGTSQGVARFDGLALDIFDSASFPGLSAGVVSALAPDPLGYLWIGIRDGGVCRFDGTRFFALQRQGSDSQPWTVNQLKVDSEGVLWVASPESLFHIMPGSGVASPSLPGLEVSALFEDSTQNLWAATTSALFRRIQAFDRLPMPLGFPDSFTHAIIQNPKTGNIWLGREDGLTILEGDFANAGLPISFRHVTLPENLDRQQVRHLLHAAQGGLWLGTAADVLRFTDGQFERLSLQWPDLPGLPGQPDEPGSPEIRQLFLDREGSLWLASDQGLFQVFEPTALPALPRPQLLQFLVDGVPTPPLGGVLSASVEQVEVEFTVPSFHSRDRLAVRYRWLADDEWQLEKQGVQGEQEAIVFPSPTPGAHGFKVQVRYDDQEWGPEYTLATWTSKAPLYLTRKFWLLLAGLVVTLLMLRFLHLRYSAPDWFQN